MVTLRVLVTGGRGFIGRHLAEELARRGHMMFLLDQQSSRRPTAALPTVEEMFVDISDSKSVDEALRSAKPDVIIHLAAVTGIQSCLEQEEPTLKTNILGTYNVVRALARSGASKIVFASSREVYGETVGLATRENAQTNPNNLYGLTKLIGEKIVRWGSLTNGLRHTILRITNVYGPGGEKYGIHKILDSIESEHEVTVMGGGQLMNFLHISDLTAAFCRVLEEPLSDNEIFNIAGPDTMALQDAVSLICSLAHRKTNVRMAPMRATETVRFIPDISKARDVLGWSPRIDFREGIRRMLSHKE